MYDERSFKYNFIYWNEILSRENREHGRQHVHCQEQRYPKICFLFMNTDFTIHRTGNTCQSLLRVYYSTL